MNKATLYGVSVGPGDPELLTLKAARVLREADVVAVPDSGQGRQVALDIARPFIEGKELLDCPVPMTRDANALATAHGHIANMVCALLDAGKSVAYLCLGDVSVYATFSYVRELVEARGYEVVAVPGVTSFCAAAARLGTALCTGSKCLVVAPASSPDFAAALDAPGTKVLMKPGRSFASLRAELESRGLAERARVVSRCGMPGERVYESLDEVDDEAGYLSVVIV